MLEGLAVWALLIYILRLCGMPWNTYSQLFAYVGGSAWLVFVWFGLITYAPMDMSGGSVVQSPHIQLRPASTSITGNVFKVHIKPNQRIQKGQLIYELETEFYELAIEEADANLITAQIAVEGSEIALKSATINYDLDFKTYDRYYDSRNTVSEEELDKKRSEMLVSEQALSNAKSDLNNKQSVVKTKTANLKQAKWNLEHTKVYAPADGFVTNFLLRKGQFVGAAPRMMMYTNEKYVLMRVNHQAIRNIKEGHLAEFATAVYPGQVFSAQVEGIIEATGESQGSLLAKDDAVRKTTAINMVNKHHFVRLKINEVDGMSIPVGSVGLAWISGTKPVKFLAFLDAIRGIVIRVKAQVYYVYSM